VTPQRGAAEVRLRDIRAHDGSQARAWEELAYQLRPPVGEDHVETRKTRAPDAGVEWYEVYADGHQEGFQAKFHANLSDALGGMRESVAAVCAKRPDLTKLTFVVPYDFTDTGIAAVKTDQDRWDDAVARWRADVPGAARLEFATLRAGDLTAKLTLKEHAGRREYWFGGLEITDDWLKDRFAETVRVAGARYTPEADSPSSVNLILDAVSNGPTFTAEIRSLLNRARDACRQDTGMWGNEVDAAGQLLDALDRAGEASFGGTDGGDELLPRGAADLASIQASARGLLDLAHGAAQGAAWRRSTNLDAATSAVQALLALATSSAAKALTQRGFALVGPAGQGKTHALMRAVDDCLQRGVPALAILGQRLSDKNWWPAIAETLDGTVVGSDEFLLALDSMAEARGCRALVVIDAINESQAAKRWRHELPAMLAQFSKYQNLALVISYRTDYRDVIGAPDSLLKIRHPGLSGNEAGALAAYCKLFGVQVPSSGLYEPALSSPLFLRMYCEVLADDPARGGRTYPRSELFELYARVIGRRVTAKLDLPPTSRIVSDALTCVADRILANNGLPVPRESLEREVDALLQGRTWPTTLFQQLASEGLIELRPLYDGTESVAFPFQAYSEHLLANRLLASVDTESRRGIYRALPFLSNSKKRRALAKRVTASPWSWRSLAVTLPETRRIELVDVLPKTDDFRLHEAMRESLTGRAPSAFGARALSLLRQSFHEDPDVENGTVDAVLALAPRAGHPGNADWLHSELVRLTMAERDASWTIATFRVDELSDSYHRLTRWAEDLAEAANVEEARLAAVALMWLLTSPNRFLRDGASKSLVKLLSCHLAVGRALIQLAREADDPYVQERLLTVAYGALLVGGDGDLEGARSLLGEVAAWRGAGLPVDVLARDSARGIASWCASRGLMGGDSLQAFEPPYGAAPPEEPPTRKELEGAFGPIKDEAGNYTDWRAAAILHSCLDWYGDFNKYVVKSDVEFFSWHPLPGPAPTARDHESPLDEVDVNWAGRWIASRAISLGWTPQRFEDFESRHDLRRGRDAHKAERFGKKYQWIAHRELLARLADNFHPSFEMWKTTQDVYQGPWVWFGRDFDPSLPPSVTSGDSRVCRVARDETAGWAFLRRPDMDVSAAPDEWVAMTDDLPSAASMFSCVDPAGRKWIAVQRYSTWDRDNAQRTGISKRERDVFFLQFSWLVRRGQGARLFEIIEARGLSGRWMPDSSRVHQQYLGETASAPIVATAAVELGETADIPKPLRGVGIRPRVAVEQFLWEGSGLDCSIDDSVDFYAPAPELLGSARWVGHQAAWSVDGAVVARAIEWPNGGNEQSVLVVDAEWLASRLRDLDSDLVVGTLSERHALPLDDDDFRYMAFSDVCYVALLASDGEARKVGPLLKVRRHVDEDPLRATGTGSEAVPDEPLDPGWIP